MARCSCSVRVLETFIRDVSGLNLRQSGLRPQSWEHRTRRPLSTRAGLVTLRPQLRTAATSAALPAAGVDDAFVPFVYSSSKSDPEPVTSPTANLNPQLSRAAVEILDDIDNFEPEIEIRTDQIPVSIKAQEVLDGCETDGAASEVATNPENQALTDTLDARHVDFVVLPSLDELAADHMTSTQKNRDSNLVLLPPSKTRADRRREEKAKRKERINAENARLALEQVEVQAILDSERAKAQANPAPALKEAVVKTARPKKVADKTRQVAPVTASQTKRERAAKPFKKQSWQQYKDALDSKFGEEAWNPRKRISPDALAGIRSLHAAQPQVYTMKMLANHFKITSEAVRRILKTKWTPNEEEAEDRKKRWEKRGEKKWTEMVETGVRPPKKWREMGVGRVDKGEVPKWKRSPRSEHVKGERWIDQPDADLFARAADVEAEQAGGRLSIADRIL